MANEKRLIEVESAWQKAQKIFSDSALLLAIRVALDKAPTVDAVEVVRCKDCKHYGWEQEPCHGRTQRFCNLNKGLVVVYRDTFCSYGERKDNA